MNIDNGNNDKVVNDILLKSLPYLLDYFSNNIDLCAAYFYRYIVLNDLESYALFNNIYNVLNREDKHEVILKFYEWRKTKIKHKILNLIKN